MPSSSSRSESEAIESSESDSSPCALLGVNSSLLVYFLIVLTGEAFELGKSLFL